MIIKLKLVQQKCIIYTAEILPGFFITPNSQWTRNLTLCDAGPFISCYISTCTLFIVPVCLLFIQVCFLFTVDRLFASRSQRELLSAVLMQRVYCKFPLLRHSCAFYASASKNARPGWNLYSDQAYSRPRDGRISASWRSNRTP